MAFASALLLFLQLQATVHPITHLRAAGPHADRAALSTPVAVDDCVECALLASGAHAVAGSISTFQASVVPSAFALPFVAGVDVPAPVGFDSRAPPSFA